MEIELIRTKSATDGAVLKKLIEKNSQNVEMEKKIHNKTMNEI